DYNAKDKMNKIAPPPLQKYVKQWQWFLRDANWYPDFPTSARQVIDFYNIETSSDTDFAMVIAINPDLVEAVLDIVGPITIDGITFNSKNLVEQLEEQVGAVYKQKGLNIFNRKEIIAKLKGKLVERIGAMTVDQYKTLLTVLATAVREKSLLLYSPDKSLQNLIERAGYGGEIRESESDFLLVADANLGALKTDPYVDRYVNYQLLPEQDRIKAKVTLTYKNNAKFTWKTTRYRDYVRLYVPLGSKLLTTEGLMDNDRTTKPGSPDSYEEIGKAQVFGGFVAIEPGETRSISFEYQLPKKILEDYKKGRYHLLYQKEPGAVHRITVTDGDKEVYAGDSKEDRIIYVKK
ncbi:MAG: DUF4012 domain-containing protein, partial [bacterium]